MLTMYDTNTQTSIYVQWTGILLLFSLLSTFLISFILIPYFYRVPEVCFGPD